MTLLEEIQAKCSAELIASKEHGLIAAQVNVGRKKLVPTEVGNGTILETIGLTVGNALLDVLNSEPNFRHVKPLLEQGRLRIDSALVRATLDSLVPAVLTAEQATALKSVAEQAAPVSVHEVINAMAALEN
jgi:hypothetical protein